MYDNNMASTTEITLKSPKTLIVVWIFLNCNPELVLDSRSPKIEKNQINEAIGVIDVRNRIGFFWITSPVDKDGIKNRNMTVEQRIQIITVTIIAKTGL